jgi:hypothetical protein
LQEEVVERAAIGEALSTADFAMHASTANFLIAKSIAAVVPLAAHVSLNRYLAGDARQVVD